MDKKKMVIFTGAGISAESGLKTFRDEDGLWENYKLEDVATPMAWARNPAMVLEFYNQRRKDVLKATPNAAHHALVKLESIFDVTIITQNIDDLHERAGSSNIIHLHGEILKSRSSTDPDDLYECRVDLHMGDVSKSGHQLRPHVVWFHEEVPMMQAAIAVSSEAAIFLVIGTSLQVYPAAGLINYAPYSSIKYLLDPNVNQAPPLKNLKVIQSKASTGVPKLVNELINQHRK